MTGPLANRTAVVIGGAEGIGAATTEELIRQGARVAVLDLTAVPTGDRCSIAVTGDVTDPAARHAVFEAAAELGGQLSILVHAPLYMDPQAAVDTTATGWRRTQEVNVEAAWASATEFVAAVSGPASIILVSSIHAFVAAQDNAAYAVSKAGLNALARALAVEWGPRNVRTNAVAPGFVAVDRNQVKWRDPVQAAAMASSNPLGRLGQPQDVAAVIAFLAGDQARHVNGTVIPVDGGQLAGLPPYSPA